MPTPSEQPHNNLEHNPTPTKDEPAGRTLRDAVTEARLGSTANSAATLARPKEDEVTPRSKAMDSVVRIGLGTEAADAGRRDQIVADHFSRPTDTHGRTADFVARQQGLTADHTENRVRAQPMQLEAGGRTLEGQTTVGRNGKEYFFSNQGQRYEMVRGEDGYSGLRPLSKYGNQDVIPINKQPQIASALHGVEAGQTPGTTRGGEPLNARPQPMTGADRPTGEPRKVETGEPRKVEPGAPHRTEPGEPRRGEPGEPRKVEPGVPHRTESGEPRRTEPGEPRRTEPGEPRRTEPGEPRRTEPGVPHRTEPGEPRRTEPGEPRRTELPAMTPAQLQQMREHLEANPALKQQLRESTEPMAAQMRERLGIQPAHVEPAPAARAEQQVPHVRQVSDAPQSQQTPQNPHRDGAPVVAPLTRAEAPAARPGEVHPTPVRAEGPAPGRTGDGPLQGGVRVEVTARGADQPHLDPAHLARTDGRSLQPAPLDQLLAARTGDQQSRQNLIDTLAMAQRGRVPEGSQNPGQVQDLVKSIGPEAFGRLRQMVQDQPLNSPLKLEGKFDAGTQARIRDFVDLTMNGTLRRTEIAGADRSMQVFSNLVKQNELLTGLVRPDMQVNATRANLTELGSIMRNLDAQQGPLNMRDLIGRAPGDSSNLAVPTTLVAAKAEQMIVREIIDRIAMNRNPMDPIQRQADPPIQTRPEMQPGIRDASGDALAAMRPEARPELRPEIKLDPKDEAPRDLNPNRQDIVIQDRNSEVAVSQVVNQALENDRKFDAERELRELNERKDREKAEEAKREEEEQRRRKLEDEKRVLSEQAEAALLAAMAAKKGKKDVKTDEEESNDKAKKDPEKRTKYIVKEGDTLESVAGKMLRDKRLSGLIYEINKIAIPTKIEKGKALPYLKVGMTLWLPTTKDIKDYRVRLMSSAGKPVVAPADEPKKFASAEDELAARFGSNWTGTKPAGEAQDPPLVDVENEMDDAARAAYAERRAKIENTLGIPLSKKPEQQAPQYVVRLGDSLKSIAMKHPALNDVKLWRLLAEVNGLPTEVDDKGSPVAFVKRGQALNLPLQEQIDAFLGKSSSAPVVNEKAPASQAEQTHTKVAEHPAPVPKPDPILAEGYKVLKQRGSASRLLQLGTAETIASGLKLRLEAKHGDSWLPVVAYEIYNDVSLRHEWKPGGACKTIRIDLPPAAATELANNDLNSNWTNYCTKFSAAT